jgi:hypothetical protein
MNHITISFFYDDDDDDDDDDNNDAIARSESSSNSFTLARKKFDIHLFDKYFPTLL